MYVPLKWIKEYTNLEEPTDDLISKIRSQLGEVESVEDYSKKYKNTVLAKILSKKNHPDADKLAIYEINYGDDTTTVVAGDKKLEKGDKVAYFIPGAKVPYNAYPEKFDGIVRPVKLRGVESNGMLASGRELDINNNHESVMKINSDLPVGTPIDQVLDMDDVVIEIENKALTNRADCFSIIGLSREIAGIQHIPFTTPEWMKRTYDQNGSSDNLLELEVRNEAEHLCARYTAISVSNIEIKDSPLWLQSKLVKSGMKPINNIVDITNYIMLLTGQPLHAFDYDKLVAGDPKTKDKAIITVRTAAQGEELTTLDGKTHKLHSTNLLICNSSDPIAVAGVMGGLSTEIDEDTKNIVIESANFDLYNNRRSSMQLGIFTDAVTRFSKGQDPNLTLPAMLKALEMVEQLAGGSASKFVDIYPDEINLSKERVITLSVDSLNRRIGTDLDGEEITSLLTNVELVSSIKDDYLTVQIPTNRGDLRDEVDIHEEVARLYGYDNIEVTLPPRDLSPTIHNPMLDLKERVRTILSNNGSSELLTYNFVSSESILESGLDLENAFELKNPLSPELKYMRTTLLPSLLLKGGKNINNLFEYFTLYEINKSHNKKVLDHDGLPAERENLTLVNMASQEYAKENLGKYPYYWAKYYLDLLFKSLNIKDIEYESPTKLNNDTLPIWLIDNLNMFDANAVSIVINPTEVGDIPFGILGEPSPKVLSNMKLPRFTSMFEIDLSVVEHLASELPTYKEPSVYPHVSYDVCYILDSDVPHQILLSEVNYNLAQIKDLITSTSTVDIYQSDKLAKSGKKYITVRINLIHKDKTLEKDETEKIIKKLNRTIRRKLNAEIK